MIDYIYIGCIAHIHGQYKFFLGCRNINVKVCQDKAAFLGTGPHVHRPVRQGKTVHIVDAYVSFARGDIVCAEDYLFCVIIIDVAYYDRILRPCRVHVPVYNRV